MVPEGVLSARAPQTAVWRKEQRRHEAKQFANMFHNGKSSLILFIRPQLAFCVVDIIIAQTCP